MNLSRLFILRPVATTLLTVALLACGLLAYRLLPLSALPQVDYPTIRVAATYPGASPEVVATAVTAPLERQFGQMPGLRQMLSTSSAGAVAVTLQFALELPLDVAEQQVQAAINAASAVLPADLPSPPVYNKVNPADAPVLSLALRSATLPLPALEDLASARVASRIAQMPGVGQVTLGGAQRPAVRVRVDPTAAAARGLTLEDVRLALVAGNVNQAKGSFNGPLQTATIDANDQMRSADEFARMVVAWRDDAPVRLRDIATVADGAENAWVAAWASDGHGAMQPAVVVDVRRQPGANVIDTVDRIRERLPQLERSLPGAVALSVLADRTTTIRAAYHDVRVELLFAMGLVVAVILVFLHSVRATLIPAVTVPLSVVGTFGAMFLLGFSLNNLTLMALTIATGFVVDDAIVMIENVARHLERGLDPVAAALTGAREIGFTIVSLTLSLVAVLIPLLFLGDVAGRLFREFAVTLAVSILVSGVLSLTLTPMMCARLLRPVRPAAAIAATEAAAPRADGWLLRQYVRALDVVLAHRGATLAVAAATLVATVVLYVAMPKGFFPVQDTGLLQVTTVADQAVSFDAMAARQQQVATTLLADPDVAALSSVIGVDGTNPSLNTGRLLVSLRPRAQRTGDQDALRARLARALAGVPGIEVFVQPVQDLSIDDQPGRAQYRFTLGDVDAARLGQWVPQLLQRLARRPELRDLSSDWQDRGRQVWVDVDRDQAGRLGIPMSTISSVLYSAFGQRLASTIFTQADLYRVVIEVDPAFARGPSALDTLFVAAQPAAGARLVPLSSLARVQEREAPLTVQHLGQFPAATVSFNVPPGVALGDAVAAVEAERAALAMPASILLEFQGATQEFRASLGSLVFLIGASVATMYIVLGVLYESFVHPLTILSTLPSAGFGALLALWLSGHDLGVVAVIGLILLIGIVKKNAIMMIDFALQARRGRGLAPLAAIREACILRFRPILMTTLAALFGALPMMLGTGVGSELRRPLGIAMVAGLLVSQMLTVFTTPVIYLAFERFTRDPRPAPDAPA